MLLRILLSLCLLGSAVAQTWTLRGCFPCTPSPNGGPVISALSCGTITTTSAICTWNTDVSSDGMILYGQDGYGGSDDTPGSNFGLIDAGGATTHTQTITGLIPGGTYFITVRSRTIGTLSKVYPGPDVTFDGTLVTTSAPSAGTTTTKGIGQGPHQIYRGNVMILQVGGVPLSGTANFPGGSNSYWITFSNLPTGVTLSCFTVGCTLNPTGSPANTVAMFRPTLDSPISVKLTASSSATLGAVTLNVNTQLVEMTGCSSSNPCTGGVNADVQTPAFTYALTVLDTPSFTASLPSCLATVSCTAIPDQATWEANMDTWGGWFCDEATGITQSTVHPMIWTGFNANAWAANKIYENGYEVKDANGNIQRVTSGRGTSGGSAPTWNGSGTTVDNTLTWTFQRAAIAGGEVNSWYYGGYNVYMQIYDWKKSKGVAGYGKWVTCANAAMQAQREWYQDALSPAGATQGWRKFPEVYEDAITRSNDAHSRTALTQLAQNGAYNDETAQVNAVTLLMRESAYLVNTERAYKKYIGTDRTTQYNNDLEILLGHIDQCCISQTAFWTQPFMVGLAAQSLINVWRDGNHDPRIPIYVKAAADYMWANLWVPDTGVKSSGTMCYNNRFCTYGIDYTSFGNSSTAEARQISLLYAPIWAWLWQMTGTTSYLTNGDVIWDEGVLNGTPDKGKVLSQNYRWSFLYVQCRTAPCN